MVRFPGAFRRLGDLAQRALKPRSRLRQRLLGREMISAYDAATRRDYELMLVRYSPELELEFEADFTALDMRGDYSGRDGLIKMIETFGEAWEQWQLRPEWIIDFGDRFVALGRFHLPATASGLEFAPEFAQAVWVSGGAVRNEWQGLSWEKGLQAAGVDADTANQILASLKRA